MEKTYTRQYASEGYFTLYTSLLFLVIGGMLLFCLDGIMFYQGKSKARMSCAGAAEHILANYDRALYDRYDLFFLDPRVEPHLEKRTGAYLEEVICDTENSILKKQTFRLHVKDWKVSTYATMQEQDFRYFIAQISDVVKYETTKDALKKILGETDAALPETFEHVTEDALVPFESVADEEKALPAQGNSPVDTLKGIMKQGVFAYVTEGCTISDTTISPSNLPSKGKKELKKKWSQMLSDFSVLTEWLKEQKLSNWQEKFTEKGVVALYQEKYFSSYLKEDFRNDTVLAYEQEYILGGNNSDKENLEYVMNRMILLRAAINTAHVFSDKEWNEKALMMATAIVGATGSPAAIESAKYAILLVVSLLEGIEDVKDLFSGGKVAIQKWSEAKKGLSYQQYLLILFFLQADMKDQILRMQDLMQINILQEEEGFLINNLRAGIEIEMTYEQKGLFYPGNYEVIVQQKGQY